MGTSCLTCPGTSLKHSWVSILRLYLFLEPSPWAQPELSVPHQAP